MPEQKESYIRALRILTSALIVGVLVFFVFGLAATWAGFIGENPIQKFANYILIGLAAVAMILFIIYNKYFNKKIESIKNSSETVKEKLNLYRASLIKCFAVFEGIALFGVILLVLTGNYWFSGIIFLMILAMASMFPTRQRVIDQLGLDWNEQQEL